MCKQTSVMCRLTCTCFVTFRIMKILFASTPGESWRGPKRALFIIVQHTFKSELEMFVLLSKHSYLEDFQACSAAFSFGVYSYFP